MSRSCVYILDYICVRQKNCEREVLNIYRDCTNQENAMGKNRRAPVMAKKLLDLICP